MDDLTTKEAALVLRIAFPTIHKWLREGRIPGAYKKGRDWFIPRGSLQKIERPPRPGRPWPKVCPPPR